MRDLPDTGLADSDAAWAAFAARADRAERDYRTNLAAEHDAVVTQPDGLYADDVEQRRQSRLKLWQAVER